MWFSLYDILMELLLAVAVYGVILILSKKWENQRVRRVVDDRTAPEVNLTTHDEKTEVFQFNDEDEPAAQDNAPHLTDDKSLKSPGKLSVIVKTMESEKTFVIESSPSDRVMDVKLKIQEVDGTSVDLQRLIFRGRPLQNQFLLESCDVVDGSVLHFVSKKEQPMQIFIRDYSGKKFTVECDENDEVEDLKKLIEFTEGIPYDCIRLLFAGRQLLDGHYLRNYNITKDSLLLLALRVRGGGFVNVRVSDDVLLSLGNFDSITELKRMIYESSGIPVHRQALLLDGNILKDGCRRVDYKIEPGCTIDLIKLKGG